MTLPARSKAEREQRWSCVRCRGSSTPPTVHGTPLRKGAWPYGRKAKCRVTQLTKMAPKRERTVKLSSDTRVKNRKMQGSGEQTSGKRQSSNSTNDKDVWLLKRQNAVPLHTAVLQHIEACLTVAEMSVLSRKRLSAIKYPKHPLSHLKQRLLKLCKKLRLPVTKVHKVKNLAKDILEEQHKMNVYEDTLESLEHEIEKTMVTVEKIEDTIVALEGKVEAMKKHASKRTQFEAYEYRSCLVHVVSSVCGGYQERSTTVCLTYKS
ncbi:uncharacterized protein LOC143764962 isoform X3 [Ranitomeya variabilis]|uniref:uncharacterized protein LOC143764962 isoform X3 n=1 Tax=Ranitomeya variabilis TaxID=490064 RepID=UPI004057A645